VCNTSEEAIEADDTRREGEVWLLPMTAGVPEGDEQGAMIIEGVACARRGGLAKNTRPRAAAHGDVRMRKNRPAITGAHPASVTGSYRSEYADPRA